LRFCRLSEKGEHFPLPAPAGMESYGFRKKFARLFVGLFFLPIFHVSIVPPRPIGLHELFRGTSGSLPVGLQDRRCPFRGLKTSISSIFSNPSSAGQENRGGPSLAPFSPVSQEGGDEVWTTRRNNPTGQPQEMGKTPEICRRAANTRNRVSLHRERSNSFSITKGPLDFL